MTVALTRRCLAAALLLAATGVAAQPAFNPNDPNAGPPPADAVPPPGIDKIEHTLEAYKKEGGVVPEVWTALDKFRPADVDDKHKKAPRQIESSDRARNLSRPDTYFTGATKTVYEPMGAGYRAYESTGDAERAQGRNVGVSYLGLFEPVVQREIEVQIRSLFLNAPVKSFSVTRMTAVRLPGTFEEAVAPNQAWKYEVDLDIEIFTQVRWTKRERKQQFKVKNDCTNGERTPASALHSRFTGGMVSITCKTTGRGDDAVHTFVYLEDYGVFFGTTRKTAKIESELVVQNWE